MSESHKPGFEALAKEIQLYPKEQLAKIKKGKKTFFIGLPKEIALQEKRITLTPDAVKLLTNNGHEIIVEKDAGLGSNFTDKEYSDAGAKIVSTAREVYQANAILKIEPPTLDEIKYLKPGKILISAYQLGSQTHEYLNAINSKKVVAMGFEFIEDKVGGMPIIRAMSEIAGSSAMLIAAQYLSTSQNGRGVMLGGITGVPPTKVVIIGAGTVAEYAARAAKGLGAEVQVFDNHIYKLRRIKYALGDQIYTSSIDTITLSESLKHADVVIGALRAEKGRNRHVVSEEMVSKMNSGAVIIDLSIDQGGCIETSEQTTHSNPTFKKYDVIHYCVPNIASTVARTATTALSNIFTPTILRAAEEGGIEEMIFSHKWFMKGVYSYKGVITNKYIAQKFNLKFKDLDLIMATRF
ncbi:MAG: alanine dehydrogenase [Cyclobacteriaceae bacterium]|nr:alanine dehydrogenase [Cyclobacteriaceae bacterium]